MDTTTQRPWARIDESDLLAFVDDQLPPGRRAEVADLLARSPADTYRVAADLAVLAGLRLLFGRAPGGSQTSFFAYPRGV